MDFLVVNFAEILFYCLAVLTVAGGVGVLVFKSPVHGALSLLFCFIMVAALFLLRHAELLAAVQVLVYGGGIMILFLFVIMLVNIKGLAPEQVYLSRLAPLAVVGGVLLGVLIAFGLIFGVLASGHGDGTGLRWSMVWRSATPRPSAPFSTPSIWCPSRWSRSCSWWP